MLDVIWALHSSGEPFVTDPRGVPSCPPSLHPTNPSPPLPSPEPHISKFAFRCTHTHTHTNNTDDPCDLAHCDHSSSTSISLDLIRPHQPSGRVWLSGFWVRSSKPKRVAASADSLIKGGRYRGESGVQQMSSEPPRMAITASR